MSSVRIKIDKNMILDELYKVRALMPIATQEWEETTKAIDSVIQLVQNAPLDTTGAQYPGINARRRG